MVPGGILELHGEKVLIEGLFSLAELQTIVEVLKEAGEEVGGGGMSLPLCQACKSPLLFEQNWCIHCHAAVYCRCCDCETPAVLGDATEGQEDAGVPLS